MMWQPIETAPKDRNIFVWFDHDADLYQDPNDPRKLTDYATWTEGGPFMDGKGLCIAKWQDAFWESVDEYGNGYWLPAFWFALQNDDYEIVVNPTHWWDFGDGAAMPEPPPQKIAKETEMPYTYNPATHAWDFPKLPTAIQRALIGNNRHSGFFRLTETEWAFRFSSGSGPYIIGTLEELLPFFQQMKIATPYVPPKSELDGLISIDLGL